MNNEKKVHVFLGAPAVLTQWKTSAKEAVVEGSSKKWLQCQVFYDKGSLNASPRECSTKESQKHFVCHEATSQLKNQSGQSSTSKSEEGNIALSQESTFENLDAFLLEQSMSKKSDILYDNDFNTRQKGKQHRKGLSNRTLLNSERGVKITEEHDHDPTNPACSGGSFETPLESYEGSRQSGENGSDNWDPNGRIAEQNAPLKEDCPEFLCDSLMEYLQNTFPAEGQGSCFRCTSLNEGLSTDAEFLSVLTASQAAILSQGLSESQFITQDSHENLKAKLETDTKDNELSCQSLPSTHNFVRPYGNSANQTVCGQVDSSENTPELFSLPSNQQLSNEAVDGRISEVSEHSFSPFTKWSKDDVEVNVEPYSGGFLCSQVADSSKWPLKRSVEATKEPEKLKQVTQTSRSPVYFDIDPPSCKKIKTMDSERISDLGHYLEAQRNRWPTPKVGFIEIERLKNCTDRSKRYHVLVTVLFRCLLKEIQIKSGTFAGCRVPIATIVVTDQSGVTIKIALWRASAFWALSVSPGDVLLVTDVAVHCNQWRGEELLQSTPRTKMIKLGPCLQIQTAQWSQTVNAMALKELIAYISAQHSHLLAVEPTNHQHLESMQYVNIYKLQPGMVVHARLKVVLITVLSENTYTYRGKAQQKVVLSVEQVKGHPGTLTLWGNWIAWHTRIQKKLGHVWDFRNLLVFQNPIAGDLELHTTPWSSCECLFDDDERAIAFKTKYQPSETDSIKMMDLSTLLHTRYSGSVQLKVHIVAMQWNANSTLNPLFTMDAFTPMETVFASLSCFTYSGCGSCGSELGFDENGIYQQCISCLPNSTLRTFYRPTMLSITDQDSRIDVFISSKLMEKIFLNIPPTWLSKLIGPSDQVTYGMVMADLCCSLFADPRDYYVLTLQSQFHLDENSIAMNQEFYLLDFCPDH
ncbi:shieldin complex subunit 2 isoform X2 [Carcharodon carcharias]|uniref:shieldin complex subunit 2 isoform X2 n=1 Tax=Carcharodon carcharias TaxID=13397 RepID=UPI001B7F33AC|nr:shieldin complex subunit 2 isoform X2 [Carcharodon carcharias]XP_041032100.1 shieldin complex subunit 2 isoform X2 [Carcharodon carcharias]